MMILNLDYATILAIASVLLSILFEIWPALKGKWDLIGKRFKPLAMAFVVAVTAVVVYGAGCYLTVPVIFNPPLVCLKSGFSDFFVMIGFGFGSQQLFYAFLKMFAGSFTPPSGFDGVDPSRFQEAPYPLGAKKTNDRVPNSKLLVTDKELYAGADNTRRLKKKG